jgi:hypothetical protein
MASQTLLSSTTRLREIEGLLPSQTGFPRQPVESGQQAIQLARFGKKGRINHVLNSFLSAPPARANGGHNLVPAVTVTASDATRTGLPSVSATLYPNVAAARESAAIFRCAGPRVRRSAESPLRLHDYGAASTPGTAGTLLVARAGARHAARHRVRLVVGMDADFRAAATVTDSDTMLTDRPSGQPHQARINKLSPTSTRPFAFLQSVRGQVTKET